jgi:tetratricopeptide (TPR) repeat protein
MNSFGTSSLSIDEQIQRAGMLSLEHSESDVVNAIAMLKEILSRPDLDPEQKLNTQLNLAGAFQRRGEHRAAIDTLNSIEHIPNVDQTVAAWIKHLAAASYYALGFYAESCKLFDETLNEIDQLANADPKMRACIALEAGKAFRAKGDELRARKCWEEALEYFEDKNEEIEHCARTKANLALDLLHDPDEARQKEGVWLLEESSNIKRLIGDLEGLANNYCNLGLYYWRKKRYERAIAYTRRDLYLSRKVGDLRAVASTLGNLAQLYAVLKQLSPARKLLREARQIGEALKDQRLIEITDRQLQLVNDIGKEAGQKKEKIGPTANCGCGSGKEYQDCCGRADFEPIDIPMLFGGVSEDLEQIVNQAKISGAEPSRLDFILRETPESKRRFAWSRINVNDGWLEMHELPDMANHHLISARILADEAKSDPDSPTKPLACVILSACALEAFINQVAFFLNEVKSFPEGKSHIIPSELSGNVLDFQRNTRLENKWDILGKALCGKNWPPPQSLWTDVHNLIYIRNELVHFKVADYEPVVPPPQKPHAVMKRIPSSIQTRKIPHGWPARLLTPSFADWCVTTTEIIMVSLSRGS